MINGRKGIASYTSPLCLQMWTHYLQQRMTRRKTGILYELGKGWHKIEAPNTQSRPDTGSYGNGTINLSTHGQEDETYTPLRIWHWSFWPLSSWLDNALLSFLPWRVWQTMIDTHTLQNKLVVLTTEWLPWLHADKLERQWFERFAFGVRD